MPAVIELISSLFLAGTVVDTKIVHPRNYDFYMCAQAGLIVIYRQLLHSSFLSANDFAMSCIGNIAVG